MRIRKMGMMMMMKRKEKMNYKYYVLSTKGRTDKKEGEDMDRFFGCHTIE